VSPVPRVLVALVALAGCGGGDVRSEAAPSSVPVTTTTTTTTAPPPTTTTVPPTTTTTPPPTTTVPVTTTTSTTTTTTVPPTTTTTAPPAPPVPAVLERGDEGEAVVALQRRLRELRFWVGAVDGVFGSLTEQAVYAFQKANGLGVDGRVGARTRAVLDDPTVPRPRSTAGRVMEVDKSRQLLLAVSGGELQWVFNTSTGTEQPYPHPDGHTAMADTPPGRHTVYYQFDGWQDGRLGPMYRPKYFHRDGIAVHGYHSVPPWPASHGCVRVSFDAMDHIWSRGLMPLGSTVLVYGATP
jgi:hypothetical protein